MRLLFTSVSAVKITTIRDIKFCCLLFQRLHNMIMFNRTALIDFMLLEFSDVRELQFLHFTIFLMVYLTIVTGNLIISSIALDHQLHIPQLIKLTCFDQHIIDMATLGVGILLGLGCFVYVLVTYVHIFTTVFRLPSGKGRQKVFSTCILHLIVFSTFSFTVFVVYLKPVSDIPSWRELIFTVIYSLILPILNPVIYSIRRSKKQCQRF